jgi:hypothetical protein
MSVLRAGRVPPAGALAFDGLRGPALDVTHLVLNERLELLCQSCGWGCGWAVYPSYRLNDGAGDLPLLVPDVLVQTLVHPQGRRPTRSGSGAHAKDSENRRVPFDPQGRLAPVLKRRGKLGPSAFVFGGPEGEYQDSFKTASESLLLRANGYDITRAKKGARVGREKLREIDLLWHDLRHEGACRLLADGVDIRTIQLMLGHADIKQTQRYLNITDEELRRAMTGVWERRRQLRAVGQ